MCPHAPNSGGILELPVNVSVPWSVRRLVPRRRPGLGPLVRTFALRSAVVFVLVGVLLHFMVQRLVEAQFHEHAEFHAVFVTDAVLEPLLRDADLSDAASSEHRSELTTALRERAVDLDEMVYRVVVWDPRGVAVLGDTAAQRDPAPASYDGLLARARDSGMFSVNGPAPYLTGSPPVGSTLRTFVPLDVDRPLVAEIHQDWSPTLAASRTFSRTLDVGLAGGLALLWALSLPIARRAGRRLHERSRTDELTELPNRTALVERLDASLRRLEPGDRCVSVLFIDLDGFKRVNDTLGHAGGDRVLQEIAERLLSCSRPTDTVARFSGDEFVVILEDTDPVLAEHVARRLLSEVRRPLDAWGEPGLSASIGMTMTGVTEVDAETLLRQADAAMYHVKQSGGDRHGVYDDALRDSVARQNAIERALGHAVDRDQFHLHFQPFVSATRPDDGVVAVEALLRWEHPDLGAVPPLEFIPLAERTGLIEQIGDWVLHEACRHLVRWQSLVTPDRRFVVFVNLSPLQLGDRLLDVVDQCLADTGADAHRLGFELTETALPEEGDDSVFDLLAALRRRGCRVALDDFGTGYSSLSRLREAPLDLLKLDRAFIDVHLDDAKGLAILTAIASLAQELGIEVLAEGVETAEQLETVARFGFDLVQGYHLARPSSAQDVADWLTSGLPPRHAVLGESHAVV